MSATGVFLAVVIGVVAGWLGDLIFDRRRALFDKLLAGVVGAFAGAFAARRLGLGLGGLAGDALACLAGAVVCLAALAAFRRAT